ncbi:unnamed protein product [Oppiella nova]|uniref:Nuclear receptor domain-containing protein n=1 Tax=Oppiella nova TaxID=334625 RepID=A0A7R9QBV0_9ACAR|nr:unnamed protein product [Oppiella nova]CAG2162608.1 unnamed protein product [Oppiella nova]
MSVKVFPKVCGVCGHMAMGKNFGAVSCEPCKAFFRRNALKNALKCHFDNKCKIDSITRKFCSRCRLDKCLAIGMRRDWILNEEEREMKKLKRLENKKWRDSHNSANNSSNTSITCDESPQSLIDSSSETSHENHISNTNQTLNNDILYEILDDNNISADALSEQIRDIETTVTNDFIDNIVDNSFDKLNTSPPYVQQIACYNVSNKTIEKAVEFAVSVIPIAQPLGQCTAGFNEKEIYLMNELMATLRRLGSPYSSNSRNLDNIYDYDYHQTATTKFDKCIRNVTKAMKGLTAFKNICCEDQISLLKYGCFDVIFLRSIMTLITR